MTKVISALRAGYRLHRYRILFLTLLASLAAAPVLRPLGLATGVIEVFLAANVVAAVVALGPGPLRRVTMLVLLVALASRPSAAWLGRSGVSAASLACWGIIALVAAASALRFAVRGNAIGGEQIFAALSVYLLVGLFFGVIYWVLDHFWPGALVVGGSEGASAISVHTAIYFSFVTLASLGYGDVLPVSDPARGLAVIEVVGGQLYLAVMVARLVGAWR